jgi:SET domain-containing protein
VGETHVGRGVFARRRLSAGLVVGEILGTVMETHPDDPQYCMELASGRLLEPASPLRYLNHCCDPNCELFYWVDEDATVQEDRLWLQTIRAIEAGEQLLIDYSWPADAAIPCRCGAENCRGWIVDPAELHLITPPAADGAASPPPSPSA